MKLILPYEVQPYSVNQVWGVHRPDIYKQFGFTNHNGVDIAPGDRNEVRAPFDYEVQKIIWQPTGGGLVLSIISQVEYEGPDSKPCKVQIGFMHLESTKVRVGDKGKAGELVAISDNTGYSTGPHTHIRHKWMRLRGSRLVDAEKNNAQNTFDPEPYRDGTFAADLIPKSNHFPFSKDLYYGVIDSEVKELQKFLNGRGFFVSTFFNGSPGKETTHFGPATQRALIKFQKAHGISPSSGYFGPITQGVIRKI